jgi:DNA modification methylase
MGVRVVGGDCREVLPTLPAGSVQCCVTSPPYWGLRDYGTAEWEGGSVWCEHVSGTIRNDEGETTWSGGPVFSGKTWFKSVCGKCGARRIDSQLGLEATPEEYIAKMVAVFREVKRVLRDDGTLWLNMGDSYASSGERQTGRNDDGRPEKDKGWATYDIKRTKINGSHGLKPKDLCMMPARLAMALQADGWYLRSEIVWHKPNPMPESVTDRPTKAHEMVYLLAKQERYYYDNEAIREKSPRAGELVKNNGNDGMSYGYDGNRTREGFRRGVIVPEYRNKRSVWTIPTQPYSEAHFATFPEEIPKLCILAGSRVGDTILDPFAGSGTVGQVALELGRRAVLIELNPAYVELARVRTFVTPGFL